MILRHLKPRDICCGSVLVFGQKACDVGPTKNGALQRTSQDPPGAEDQLTQLTQLTVGNCGKKSNFQKKESDTSKSYFSWEYHHSDTIHISQISQILHVCFFSNHHLPLMGCCWMGWRETDETAGLDLQELRHSRRHRNHTQLASDNGMDEEWMLDTKKCNWNGMDSENQM